MGRELVFVAAQRLQRHDQHQPNCGTRGAKRHCGQARRVKTQSCVTVVNNLHPAESLNGEKMSINDCTA